MKKGYLFLVLLVSFSLIYSQNYVDVLRVYGNTTPLNKFDSSSSTTRVNEIVGDLSVPIKLNDKSAIITGLIYEGLKVKLFPNQNPATLNAVALKIGVTGRLSEKWSGTLVLLPKAASNNNAFSSNVYQIGGVAYMKYKKKDNLNYRVGFYANTDLFGPLFVPMLGLYYKSPNKKFETTIMMPFQADFNYQLAPFFHIGFNYNAQIRTFFLSDVTPAYNSAYLTKSTDEFFLYASFNINKNFSFQARIGQSVARDYRIFNSNDKVTLGLPALYIGDDRRQLNSDFSNGLIYQMVFQYRLNLPE